MPVGGAALDLVGVPLPEETVSAAKDSDAVLLGAIGGLVTSLLYSFVVYVFISYWKITMLLVLFSGTNGIRMKNI